MDDFYTRYYMNQAGAGLTVYQGPRFQHGHGFGSFFGRMFRSIAPVILPGLKSAGKQLLKAGVNVASDALQGQNIGESVKEHFSNAGRTIARNTLNGVSNLAGGSLPETKRANMMLGAQFRPPPGMSALGNSMDAGPDPMDLIVMRGQNHAASKRSSNKRKRGRRSGGRGGKRRRPHIRKDIFGA